MTWVEAVRCVTLVPYITTVIDSVRVQRIEALSGGSLAPQLPDQRPTAQMDKTPTALTLSPIGICRQTRAWRPPGWLHNLAVKRHGTGSVPSREDGTDLAATTIAFRRKRRRSVQLGSWPGFSTVAKGGCRQSSKISSTSPILRLNPP